MVIEDRLLERALLVSNLQAHDVRTAGDWVEVAATVNGGQWKPDAVVIGQTPGLRTGLLVSVLRKVYGPQLRVVLFIEETPIASVIATAARADAWVTPAELARLGEIVIPGS